MAPMETDKLNKAKLDWIKMNKKRLDEIERNKRRDFRLVIILVLLNIVLSLVTLFLLYYA